MVSDRRNLSVGGKPTTAGASADAGVPFPNIGGLFSRRSHWSSQASGSFFSRNVKILISVMLT